MTDGANSVISSNKIDSETNIGYVGIGVHNASNTSSKVTYNTISHASTAIYSTSPLNIINNNTDTLTATNVAVTGVAINKTSDTITAGNTDTLTATISPANATNQAVTWTTSNASVATVAGGVATAVAAGNATITVTTTDGSKTATCAVTVQAASALARLTIAGTIPTMSVGGNTFNLKGLALAGTDQYGNSFGLTSLTPTWAMRQRHVVCIPHRHHHDAGCGWLRHGHGHHRIGDQQRTAFYGNTPYHLPSLALTPCFRRRQEHLTARPLPPTERTGPYTYTESGNASHRDRPSPMAPWPVKPPRRVLTRSRSRPRMPISLPAPKA